MQEIETIVPKSKGIVYEKGFKTWCENTAIEVRKRLGLASYEPLPPKQLAAELGVTLWSLNDVPGLPLATAQYLSSSVGDEWSAVTVESGSRRIIVINERHSVARQSSDLMHELAHIIRGHKAAQLYISDDYALREYDETQEAEADWFAGTLLLPRTALSRCKFKGLSSVQVMELFEVSKQLLTYRNNVTGVSRQFKGRSSSF